MTANRRAQAQLMTDVPYGYCQCGCGQKTKIATQSDSKRGYIRGEPVRFIHSHSSRIRLWQPAIDRFWSKVEISEDKDACWIWKAGLSNKGYGSFNFQKKMTSAHRVAYQLTHGEIPEGLCVLHNCPGGDNPACCNPNHLFLGTQLDNIRDMVQKGRQAKGEYLSSKLRKGESHSQHKATSEQVRFIRQRFAEGGISKSELAIQVGLGRRTVIDIINLKSWKHIK